MTPNMTDQPSRRVAWAVFILGVAFSGFFDGILLHQVLQWHHLLSLVPGPAFDDPRVQVFADGVFHVLMYVLAMTGLILLWRKGQAEAGETPRRMAGLFLAGFGAWNLVDIGLFHWVLRLHNIRVDVANPLAWDIGWLVAFGVVPLLIAAVIANGRRPPSNHRPFAAFLSIAVLAAGLWALAPPKSAMTAVLFRPGLTDAQRWAAIARADARVLATDTSGDLMVLTLPDGAARWGLFADGALIVGGSAFGGCASAISAVEKRGLATPT